MYDHMPNQCPGSAVQSVLEMTCSLEPSKRESYLTEVTES
jgi:hypothetical protein